MDYKFFRRRPILIVILCFKLTTNATPVNDEAKESLIQSVMKEMPELKGRERLAQLSKSELIAMLYKMEGKLRVAENEAGRFKWPITIANEINTFFETHDSEVTVNSEEEKMLKNMIPDQQRRVRARLVVICEHILLDLNNTDPDIQLLNQKIDSDDNMFLKMFGIRKRRNVFCNALVHAKTKRNKIHDLLHYDNTTVAKVRLFGKPSWNECILIFINAMENGLNDLEQDLDIVELKPKTST